MSESSVELTATVGAALAFCSRPLLAARIAQASN
jgi:hypothetical protein